jgi:hypothetical protein
MSNLAAPSSATGPGITSASFSLAAPRNPGPNADGDLVITCDIPESPEGETDLYASLTRPIVDRITIDASEESTEYATLIHYDPADESRVSCIAAATEAATKRLQDIYKEGSAVGSSGFLPGWLSTIQAYKEFSEDLYYGIVAKESANLAKLYPQASLSARMDLNRPIQGSLPSQLSEHIQLRKAWEHKKTMYEAVHTAGESLKSLFDLVPSSASTMYKPSEGKSELVFQSASETLSRMGDTGEFYAGQLAADIESFRHPNMATLMENNGHETAMDLREHLLCNAKGVCELSTKFEEGGMAINAYIEELLTIGKSADPGKADTEMLDEKVSETGTQDGDTVMTDPVVSEAGHQSTASSRARPMLPRDAKARGDFHYTK